jgi:hypothetical protein
MIRHRSIQLAPYPQKAIKQLVKRRVLYSTILFIERPISRGAMGPEAEFSQRLECLHLGRDPGTAAGRRAATGAVDPDGALPVHLARHPRSFAKLPQRLCQAVALPLSRPGEGCHLLPRGDGRGEEAGQHRDSLFVLSSYFALRIFEALRARGHPGWGGLGVAFTSSATTLGELLRRCLR